MISAGPSGFYNAPASKFLLVSISGINLLASILNWKQNFHLQLIPHLTVYHQFWRLLTHHCAFASSGELFFGGLLLYHMRVIERHFGTAKYASFIFVSIVLATILETGALISGSSFGLNYIPAGPYALLFSIIYQYYRVIPVSYKFRISGITLGDKIYIYALAAQLIITRFPTALTPAIIGLLTGALYRSDIGNIKQWRFPPWLQRLSLRILGPLLRSTLIARSTATTQEQRYEMQQQLQAHQFAVMESMTGGLRNRRARNQNNNQEPAGQTVRQYIDTIAGRAPQAGAVTNPPSEEHIALISTMFPGQSREQVVRALNQARNDVNRAVEIMLSSMPEQ